MREIAGKAPLVSDKGEVEPLSDLRHTLAEHYAEKRKYFAWDWPANYDQDLRRIFSDGAEGRRRSARHALPASRAGAAAHTHR